MRAIGTDGIFSIEPVEGISGWYYGCDYANGDLFEAESCTAPDTR